MTSSLDTLARKLGYVNWVGDDSVGFSGGLFLCWSFKIVVTVLFIEKNYVCSYIRDECNELYDLLCVYGAPNLADKEQVQDTLRAFIWSHPGKVLVINDFNQLENASQKLGVNSVIPGSFQFQTWKIECNLLDLPYHGVPYTWTNNRENEEAIFERLETVYCNDAWRTTFPQAIVITFPIFISDHGPIILDYNPTNMTKKRPYRIENWYLEYEEIGG